MVGVTLHKDWKQGENNQLGSSSGPPFLNVK